MPINNHFIYLEFCLFSRRDHPTTVKRRFFSVSIVMLMSPIFIYVLFFVYNTSNVSMWAIMGFRIEGCLTAMVVPLLLTAILFLGPISAIIINGAWKVYLEPFYWVDCFKNILWIRNHIVAPLSEEFTFRACMMPLLLQSYRPLTAILLTPLFFGVAHLHHNIERVRSGMNWKTALIVSCKCIQLWLSSSKLFVFLIYTMFPFFSVVHFASQHFNLLIPAYLAFIQHIYSRELAISLHHWLHTCSVIIWDFLIYQKYWHNQIIRNIRF